MILERSLWAWRIGSAYSILVKCITKKPQQLSSNRFSIPNKAFPHKLLQFLYSFVICKGELNIFNKIQKHTGSGLALIIIDMARVIGAEAHR